MERNILLTIEYDGTGFSGWQRQPDRRTVQGTLEEALRQVRAAHAAITFSDEEEEG